MHKESSLVRTNLRIYGWVKVLTKRVYLPLISVYLVEVGGVSLQQIGFLVALAAVCSLVANIPTGYLADRWTRKGTLQLGAFLLFLASAVYALRADLAGGIVATILESFGFACINGSGEALVHDTLAAENRTRDYVKMSGRAQSFGLVGNMILIGIVPMTYAIDKRLPFVCGMIACLIFSWVLTKLQEPPRPARHQATNPSGSKLKQLLKRFVTKKTIVFFVILGLTSGSYSAYTSFTDLSIVDMGFNPAWFGWVFAASSLVGAVCGRYVHKFTSWSLLQYSLFDVALCAGYPILIGLTHNVWAAVIGMIINLGFWRIRNIVYQDQLLNYFGHHAHKATLISVTSFFSAITAWLPLVCGAVVGAMGFYNGFIVIGGIMLAVLSAGFVVGVRRWEGGLSEQRQD